MWKKVILFTMVLTVLSTAQLTISGFHQQNQILLTASGDDDPIEPLPEPIPPDRTPGNTNPGNNT